MKVLVTGNRGYIGSVISKMLGEQCIDAIGVDHDSSKPESKYIWDYSTPFQQITQLNDVDTIFHLAAEADVGKSVSDPSLFYDANIGATSTFLRNLVKANWKGKIIFSSTAAVYEETSDLVNENSTKGSPNPYGKSKLACEWALEDFSKAHGIDIVTFRYFNVAGAYGDCGDHLDAGHIISRLCHSVYNKETFTLNGNDKQTHDGTCIRDYLHVRDVCEAHLHAVNWLDNNPGYHTFNLGTNKGVSNLEIIKAFERFSGHKVDYNIGPGRPGDPDYLVADASAFVENTGYRYNYSNLENIISSAWIYYRNRMEQK